MGWMVVAWSVVCRGSPLWLPPAAAADLPKLAEGLRFYADFAAVDAVATAQGEGRPVAAEKLRAAPGRVGTGLDFREDGQVLTYATYGNLLGRHGTIALWLQLHPRPADDLRDRQVLRGYGSLMLVFSPRHHTLIFATPDRQEGWWHYAPGAPCEADDAWRHVAVTWGEGRTQLFLDGQKAGEAPAPPIVLPLSLDAQIALGSDGGGHVGDAAVDELATWGRVLTPEEIARLHADPEGAAAELRTAAIFRERPTGTAAEPLLALEITNPPSGERPEPTYQRPDIRDTLYLDGQTVEVAVRLLRDLPGPARLTVRLYDCSSSPPSRSSEVLRGLPEPRAGLVERFTFHPARRGPFRLTAEVSPAEEGNHIGLPLLAEALFGIIAPPPDVATDDSMVGLHVWLTPFFCRLYQRLGVQWLRIHDAGWETQWATVEGQGPGEYEWHNDHFQTAREFGFAVLGSLNRTPAWAADAPPEVIAQGGTATWPYPPKSLEAWKSYVRAVVSHYRPFIRHWEVWNEPNTGIFWQGTPERYVQVVAAAAEAAREVDPDCVIVGPAIGGLEDPALRWLEATFRAGLLKRLDVLSYHGYLTAEDMPTVLGERIERVRALMRQYGEEKPLWDTEFGHFHRTLFTTVRYDPRSRHRPPDEGEPELDPVALFPQHLCVSREHGVERLFYYDGTNPPETEAYYYTGLLEVTGAPSAPALAYGTAARYLDGAAFVRRLDPVLGVYVYLFLRGNTPIAVVWRVRDGGTLRVPLPAGRVRVADVFGQEIIPPAGETLALPLRFRPTYILAAVGDAAAWAEAWSRAKVTE